MYNIIISVKPDVYSNMPKIIYRIIGPFESCNEAVTILENWYHHIYDSSTPTASHILLNESHTRLTMTVSYYLEDSTEEIYSRIEVEVRELENDHNMALVDIVDNMPEIIYNKVFKLDRKSN